MPNILDRLKKSWNAFLGRDPTFLYNDIGPGSYYRPDRNRFTTFGANKSIVSTIYNRIAVDCSMIDFYHVRLNEEGRYEKMIDSPLNYIFTQEANIDQASKSFLQDIVMSMFDEGVVAVVPTDFVSSPSFKVYELRTAKIVEWYPKHIRVNIYNEDTGNRTEYIVPKDKCAIIENPFYSIMNEPNSLSQRLIRILAQLDRTNEQNSSGKMDLIIQLPYAIKQTAKAVQAEERRKAIEAQLMGSQYGIAYIDGTEKIVQLNRSLENNLWQQATELTQQLYNQFGLSEKIFNETASEEEQLTYYNQTVNPILSAIQQEFERKFLSKTARTQKQAIRYFKDPFKLVPVNSLAEIADKFTRNEIMTSNEVRSVIGLKPADDPRADELINANINQSNEDPRANIEGQPTSQGSSKPITSNTSLDEILSKVSGMEISK